ncbi:treble-clef zinc-finger protein [Sinobaca qinghaiensis]|uniref:Treble-clef zinc-finger protein n=1 Tax=Sinobaca qinghaiensis TaxID=342944 RepID=A0A419UX80_9BACL|nr:FusB/FusC family EF-G-binding protein [Sinobaca qinghaiensis]RKD69739.1 treble-clef zinc-finger protein [Sinobaca qinghaiensis]
MTESNKVKIEPFLRNDQYNFLKRQVKIILQAHAATQDQGVLDATRISAVEKVLELLPPLTDEQKQFVLNAAAISESLHAERYLFEGREYVIPFPELSDSDIRALFPKAKKINIPELKKADAKRMTYMSWNDIRSERKYIIFPHRRGMTGWSGSFKPMARKGICAVCHGHTNIGLFMAVVKSGRETYTSRGNYICQSSETCNDTISSLQHINDFIETLNKF